MVANVPKHYGITKKRRFLSQKLFTNIIHEPFDSAMAHVIFNPAHIHTFLDANKLMRIKNSLANRVVVHIKLFN